MLYYLRQEVIGDQADKILEGADSRLVQVQVYFFCFMTLACIKYTHYYNAEFKGCYTLPLKCPFSSSLIILSRAVGNFVWGGNGVENNRSRFFSSANIEGLFCLNLKIKIC